jgi:hypothetical protein
LAEKWESILHRGALTSGQSGPGDRKTREPQEIATVKAERSLRRHGAELSAFSKELFVF